MYLSYLLGKYRIMAHVPNGNKENKDREIRTYLYKYRS